MQLSVLSVCASLSCRVSSLFQDHPKKCENQTADQIDRLRSLFRLMQYCNRKQLLTHMISTESQPKSPFQCCWDNRGSTQHTCTPLICFKGKTVKCSWMDILAVWRKSLSLCRIMELGSNTYAELDNLTMEQGKFTVLINLILSI